MALPVGDLTTGCPSQNKNSRLPALTTVVSVDELSTEYGLDAAQRKAAHAFCKLSSEDRSVTLLLPLLQTERQNKEILEQMQQTQASLGGIAGYCTQTWKPSKEQTKLLKALLRHYIIRPITSYNNLVFITETYIVDHATSLRLELYKKDPIVKSVVHELLLTENNAQRSALRKLEIMASMALMRNVAKPLIGKETTRGGDTGFWAELKSKLDILYGANSNERESPEWRKWEQDIIAQDNSKYNRRAAESNARTQAEIDAAMLAHAAPIAAAENDNNEEGAVNEDRQVHISGLGDLASLAATPVARSGE
ncbi:hypothetical protein B0H14DRAFT_3655733 [Mycena olivaceomarginata]|nr:hypothetical protein B0H14DRAFT_3655733 [Mycena olivaceomarginata]